MKKNRAASILDDCMAELEIERNKYNRLLEEEIKSKAEIVIFETNKREKLEQNITELKEENARLLNHLNILLDGEKIYIKRIAELTQRWVMVEDETPPEYKTVSIILDDKFEDEGFIHDGEKWYINSIEGDAIDNKVIAWLKMPDEPQFEDVKE